MFTLISEFPQHLEDALQTGARTPYKVSGKQFDHIIISGLGGSGIGGKIVSQLVAQICPLPLICVNDYSIPSYAGKKSLVIISSYSGDTEETVATMNEAISCGAEVACISSGGKILSIAKERGLNHFIVPGGNPPRSMIGYSLVLLHFILHREGMIDESFAQGITSSAQLLRGSRTAISEEAVKIANEIGSRIPVLYAGASYEGLLVRWRQQLNENAKILCWHHVLPEMNHNELVGWTGGDNRFVVMMIHNEDDHVRTKLRMGICRDLIAEKCDKIIDITSKGNSALERTIYLIHLGDLVSVELSAIRGVDAIAIPAINFLKDELSKHP